MDPPKLTTMVVLYTTGVKLDTNCLVHNLPLTNRIIKVEKQGVLKRGESKKDRVRHRTVPAVPKRTTGFGHNSITLVLLSNGDGTQKNKEITVKIFQNGVFHITGVLDETYDRDVMSHLRKQITETCPAAILEGTWDNETRRVVLMNYKTRIVGVDNLSRESLSTNLRRQGFKTNFEPAVYPAVKIYFADTKWIAKVFRTGNIILTGMTTAEECSALTTKLSEALGQAVVSMPRGSHGSSIRA
jgi:TATA-box binding protein (TBP) (component of TFIID and TFIIIB)